MLARQSLTVAVLSLAVHLAVHGSVASAQDEVYIRMTPLQGTAGAVNPMDPQEWILSTGGETIEAEVWAGNWGWYDTCQAYQAFLDCDTYQFIVNGSETGVCVQAVSDEFYDDYWPYGIGVDTARAEWIFFDYAAFGNASCGYMCDPDACGVTVSGRFNVSGSIYTGGLATDPGEWVYLGTFSFDVPLAARGTAEVGLNELSSLSMLKDSLGQAIVPTVFTKMKITVETGMCCVHDIGPLGCEDGVTKSTCDGYGGVWVKGSQCSGLDGNEDGVDDNCLCGLDEDCADGDACTTNECVREHAGDTYGACLTLNVDIEDDECCDPTCVYGSLSDLNGNGTIASNVDGSTCTLDLCDGEACALGDQCGVPWNPPTNPGGACDDADTCTTDDICDDNGVCAGTDIRTIACPGGDDDCIFPENPISVCEEGFCTCEVHRPNPVEWISEDFQRNLVGGWCTEDADCSDGSVSECYCILDEGRTEGSCYVPCSRYLRVDNANNSGTATALRVTLEGEACGPWWVGEPYNSGAHYYITVATLVDEPVYQATWPEELEITDCEIVPGETYVVQAIRITGDIANEDDYSTGLSLRTPTLWGDVVGTCAFGHCLGPNLQANIDDILAEIAHFQSKYNGPHAQFDIAPAFSADSMTDQRVIIDDILGVIDGFQSKAYKGAGPCGC